jgi:hypothetical protein
MVTCTGVDAFFPSVEQVSPFDDIHDGFELVPIPLEGSGSKLLPESFEYFQTETDSTQEGDISQEPQDPIKSLNIYEVLQEASAVWTQLAIPLDTTLSHNFRIDDMEVEKRAIKASKPRYSRWSEDEDKKLLQLVNSIGENWYVIARYFPDKNWFACRYRYINKRNPSLKYGPFLPDETEQLIHYVKKYSKKWVAIGKLMNRSPESLRNKYISIIKNQNH